MNEEPIQNLSGWRRFALRPLGVLLRLWGRTLRFEIAAEDRRSLERRDAPVEFVLWHNRLFLTPEIYRRYRGGRPLCALISASRDGAWLAAFFDVMGMRAIRGSSSRLGREAATALVETLRQGNDIGVTPDGPRGPCYDFKPGAVIVARRVRAPVLLFGAGFGASFRLKSWDGFFLPMPFARVRLKCEEVPPPVLADRDAAMRAIAARLREINPD